MGHPLPDRIDDDVSELSDDSVSAPHRLSQLESHAHGATILAHADEGDLVPMG